MICSDRIRQALAAAALTLMTGCATASPAPAPPSDLTALVRAHVKHVFVIYQENHSFDNYFGTYPGAENLATTDARAHGARQYDPIGRQWVTTFGVNDPDIGAPSQSRAVVFHKMDGGKMDRFVAEQELVSQRKGYDRSDAERIGLLTMAHYDCDTIPFLWKYAHAFTLFDHVFEGLAGPSTPGNIDIIAGQAGMSQGQEVYDDAEPAYGPYSEAKDKFQRPQRYATLPLTLSGTDAAEATRETQGVRRDLTQTAQSRRTPVSWGWYQEGYVSPTKANPGYEAHHNAPQYFAYLRNNSVYWTHVHPIEQVLTDLRNGRLARSGIFYIKGGSRNSFGWKPANHDAFVQAHFLGDDDHPGSDDSDRQVAQSFVATFVNAIARSTYWKDSAIIITWDDPGGFYDHVTPPRFERCSDGKPCGDGPRLPFILISPYARASAVVHDAGDTTSVVKFAETLFGLPALATLPDERGRPGPRDANPAITNLLGAFDPARLRGTAPPIPASEAIIPDALVNRFPAHMSCASLHITPVSIPGEHIPRGFAPRPVRYRP